MGRGVALLLWLLLGWVGAHRFYCGKYRSGVGMAVLGIGALAGTSILVQVMAAVWWFVDLFLILTGRMLADRPPRGRSITGRCAHQPRPRVEDAPSTRTPRSYRRRSVPSAAPAPAPQPPARLQQRILLAANQAGGVITPTIAAMRIGVEIETARAELEALVDAGHAQLHVRSNDGVLVYTFADLLTDEKRAELETWL